MIYQNEIHIQPKWFTLSHLQPKWFTSSHIQPKYWFIYNQNEIHIQPKWFTLSHIQPLQNDFGFFTWHSHIVICPKSVVPILPWFSEGAPRLRIQTIAPYPTIEDAINKNKNKCSNSNLINTYINNDYKNGHKLTIYFDIFNTWTHVMHGVRIHVRVLSNDVFSLRIIGFGAPNTLSYINPKPTFMLAHKHQYSWTQYKVEKWFMPYLPS